MKKTFSLLLICSALCILTACGILVSESETSKQLAESYDFYSDSIDVLKEDMELDTEKANAVFEALVTVGLDEKITYCFDKDGFYKVWWGLTAVDVYLSDGVVEKIMNGNLQIYPSSLNSPEEEALAEEEAQRIAEEEARIKAEEEARIKAEEEARIAAEQQEELAEQQTSDTSPSDPIVYITNTGEKYHRDGCRTLKSKIERKLSEVRGNYGPCGICNPPQ